MITNEYYERTRLEIIRFCTEDVLTPSGEGYEGWNPNDPGGSGGDEYEGWNPHP